MEPARSPAKSYDSDSFADKEVAKKLSRDLESRSGSGRKPVNLKREEDHSHTPISPLAQTIRPGQTNKNTNTNAGRVARQAAQKEKPQVHWAKLYLAGVSYGRQGTLSKALTV